MTEDEPRANRPPLGEAAPTARGSRRPRPGRGTRLGEAAPTTAVLVPTLALVGVGTAIWSVALVATLVVPSLHEGDRSWWPWSCVTGIALGAFGWWYVSRTEGGVDGTDRG